MDKQNSRFTVEQFSTIQQGVKAYSLRTGAATVYNAIEYDGKVVTLEQVYRTSWGDIVTRRVPDGRLKAALLDAIAKATA